ncbi:hypothetical protein AW736_01050 [Termitidicoccus mucosus]|uniref:Uncharacterized protein n=1 Tax=Termitidicoccus mucosus TaxID=1184151 RepID=A0A178IK46_9BACT|nr:hypothetical protein AW736_01050 [Opitutaceae bacterium TSB47]
MVIWLSRRIVGAAAGDAGPDAGVETLEAGQVAPENRVFACAVLEAGEVCRQFPGRLRREGVDHPVGLPFRPDEPPFAKVGEVFRDLYLRLAQHFLKMADAKRPPREQVQDAQTRPVAEALVNLNKVHKADNT